MKANQYNHIVKNGTVDAPLGVFRFSHSGVLLPTLTILGMNKDEERLIAGNFELQGERKWRASLMDAFGSNIIAILYKCNTSEEYKVSFYQNEHVVNYPGCNGSLCSWTYLQKQLNSAFTCNADFCNKSSVSVPQISFISAILLFLLISIFIK